MHIRTFFTVIIVLALTLIVVPGASAHARQPRLEINVERMNPGGVVDVRGVEFDYEQVVKLYLERTGVVIQLGEATADLEGTFVHIVVLPVDMPQGEYKIRAVTDHHNILSPALMVQGQPVPNEGGGQGERDEDDSLLAPMPTFAPGVVPGGVLQPTIPPAPQETPVSRGIPTTAIVLSILSMLAVFVVFRQRVMSKR
jgi:hypothetical protein